MLAHGNEAGSCAGRYEEAALLCSYLVGPRGSGVNLVVPESWQSGAQQLGTHTVLTLLLLLPRRWTCNGPALAQRLPGRLALPNASARYPRPPPRPHLHDATSRYGDERARIAARGGLKCMSYCRGETRRPKLTKPHPPPARPAAVGRADAGPPRTPLGGSTSWSIVNLGATSSRPRHVYTLDQGRRSEAVGNHAQELGKIVAILKSTGVVSSTCVLNWVFHALRPPHCSLPATLLHPRPVGARRSRVSHVRPPILPSSSQPDN